MNSLCVKLNQLPTSFDQLKVSYNTHKDKGNIDELISICVHLDKVGSVNFMVQLKPRSEPHKNHNPNKKISNFKKARKWEKSESANQEV